ncbi:transposase [Phragmitibacter flavus]|uniref:Transposase n=1 Tax=Phragmitibacter flavus TaxID=2576071 RepID=A0A5R8K706_9BACT|nr:transposase [Phragmitibacter flavus]TLD68153.1 transposase [Phragmitibacter flavus]
MRKRHSVEQIIKTLKQVEGGARLPDICRELNISEQTFYRWKRKYGGMDQSEARRLKDLEEENSRLKRLVADQALDIQILKEVNSKKW